jgi:hypothetical protein
MRAAMVGGAAYHVGKQRQQGQMAEQEQDAQIEDLQAQQSAPPPVAAAPPPPAYAAPPPPAAAPGGMTDNTIEQLTKLGQLRDAGVLTEDEFAQQKARLLG